MQMWVVCEGFNQLACVCACEQKKKKTRGEMFNIPFTAGAEKCCLAATVKRGRVQHTNDLWVISTTKRKRLMTVFFFFSWHLLWRLIMKLHWEMHHSQTYPCSSISMFLVSPRNVLWDKPTWTYRNYLIVYKSLAMYTRFKLAIGKQTLWVWHSLS